LGFWAQEKCGLRPGPKAEGLGRGGRGESCRSPRHSVIGKEIIPYSGYTGSPRNFFPRSAVLKFEEARTGLLCLV